MKRNPPTIEIYPMKNLSNGDSTLIENSREEPEFYDVLVRFPGDDPLDEAEDLPDYDAAMRAAKYFQEKYPGSLIEDII